MPETFCFKEGACLYREKASSVGPAGIAGKTRQGFQHAARCSNRRSHLCLQTSTPAARGELRRLTVRFPQASMVHTAETIRVRYFMDLLMEKQRPVMLVGNAGTGKSVLMWDKLEALSADEYLVQSVPFNFYTTSAMLQGKAGLSQQPAPCRAVPHGPLALPHRPPAPLAAAVLEKPLEKKSGRNYGPPGTRKLIYFIDDMNMPEVDKYGTVAPHTLIRQHMDHGHW